MFHLRTTIAPFLYVFFLAGCARETQGSSGQGVTQITNTSTSVSSSQQCRNGVCTETVTLTSQLDAPLASEEEYKAKCEALYSESLGKKTCTEGSTAPAPTSSEVTCLFKGLNNADFRTIKLEKTVSAGVDVSGLCGQNGVTCEATKSACSGGETEIKITDKNGVLQSNSSGIAKICYAYSQPFATPSAFKCTYLVGSEESKRITVGEIKFMAIETNPTAVSTSP